MLPNNSLLNPHTLYNLCLHVSVLDCVTYCKFRKKEFRILPNNVLFDFYFKMFAEKRLCLLGIELSELPIFLRMLKVPQRRTDLFTCFQSLLDHGSNIADELLYAFRKLVDADDDTAIETGLMMGCFLNEGGWYVTSIKFLNLTEQACKKKERCAINLRKLLDCYHKRLHAEAMYCLFKEAEKTFEATQVLIKELKEMNELPNLSGLYTNYSNLYYIRSEYDEAFKWAKEAMQLLEEDLPARVIIDVLRQTAKCCTVKRRYHQASLLIKQAVSMSQQLYELDKNPQFSNTLMDYGFYLLNFDSHKECVKVYENALVIRKRVFQKDNILVAIGYEDLAYALYVNEYSSGRFLLANECAEESINIREKILPPDHLLLASCKRVRALILEEMALDLDGDTTEQNRLLAVAESLHQSALTLSQRAFGENNVQSAKHYGNLGRLYQSMHQYEKAEKMHLTAIAIKEELLGPNDYEVGLSVGHLASLYNYHMKRYEDAEKLYLRSIQITFNIFGGSFSGLEYDYRGLINVYTELHDLSKMLLYNQVMRDWKRLRENIKKAPVYPNCSRPLREIIYLFLDMCRSLKG